jgi:hypothetical protein
MNARTTRPVGMMNSTNRGGKFVLSQFNNVASAAAVEYLYYYIHI